MSETRRRCCSSPCRIALLMVAEPLGQMIVIMAQDIAESGKAPIMVEALARRRRRRPTVDLEAIDAAVKQGDSRMAMFATLVPVSDPETDAARSEVRRLLEHAIDTLPEPFRIVFVMRAVEEISTAETASHLNLREETVKTRLHRARRMLREALDTDLASMLSDAFPFEGRRCDRLTSASSIGSASLGSARVRDD